MLHSTCTTTQHAGMRIALRIAQALRSVDYGAVRQASCRAYLRICRLNDYMTAAADPPIFPLFIEVPTQDLTFNGVSDDQNNN